MRSTCQLNAELPNMLLLLLTLIHLLLPNVIAQYKIFDQFKVQDQLINTEMPLVFSFEPFDGSVVSIRLNQNFYYSNQIFSDHVPSNLIAIRYKTNLTDDWREVPFFKQGMRLKLDSLCDNIYFQTTILPESRTFNNIVRVPQPYMINRSRGLKQSITVTDYRSVLPSQQSNSSTSIIIGISYYNSLAYWTPEAGITLVSSHSQVRYTDCKILFTGHNDSLKPPVKINEQKTTGDIIYETFQFDESVASHQCQIRFDVVYELEETGNRIGTNLYFQNTIQPATRSLTCQKTYTTSENEAAFLNPTCASLQLYCDDRRSKYIAGCNYSCSPSMLIWNIGSDAGSSEQYLNISWSFASSIYYRNIQEYQLRYANAIYDNNWTLQSESDEHITTLQPTVNYFHIVPTTRRRIHNYTIQVCIMYNQCSTLINWDIQPKYHAQLIDERAIPIETAAQLIQEEGGTIVSKSNVIILLLIMVINL